MCDKEWIILGHFESLPFYPKSVAQLSQSTVSIANYLNCPWGTSLLFLVGIVPGFI